jgi:hypothetical protein
MHVCTIVVARCESSNNTAKISHGKIKIGVTPPFDLVHVAILTAGIFVKTTVQFDVIERLVTGSQPVGEDVGFQFNKDGRQQGRITGILLPEF